MADWRGWFGSVYSKDYRDFFDRLRHCSAQQRFLLASHAYSSFHLRVNQARVQFCSCLCAISNFRLCPRLLDARQPAWHTWSVPWTRLCQTNVESCCIWKAFTIVCHHSLANYNLQDCEQTGTQLTSSGIFFILACIEFSRVGCPPPTNFKCRF